MKSQTLSQFQYVIQELDTFARTTGAKDKAKRKGKGLGTAGLATGAVGAGATSVGLNKLQTKAAVSAKNISKAAQGVEKKAFRSAVNGLRSPEESAKLAGSLKKMAANRAGVSKLAGKGKVAAGLAAGGLLAGAAVNALRNRKKNK